MNMWRPGMFAIKLNRSEIIATKEKCIPHIELAAVHVLVNDDGPCIHPMDLLAGYALTGNSYRLRSVDGVAVLAECQA